MSRWTRLPLTFLAFVIMCAVMTWALFEILSVANDLLIAVRSS